jgi:hypothetical protein
MACINCDTKVTRSIVSCARDVYLIMSKLSVPHTTISAEGVVENYLIDSLEGYTKIADGKFKSRWPSCVFMVLEFSDESPLKLDRKCVRPDVKTSPLKLSTCLNCKRYNGAR